MIRVGILILVLAIAPAIGAQQTGTARQTATANRSVTAQEKPSTTIRGRVIAAENRQPLRRALVSPVPRGVPPALTDDEGRFELGDADYVTSVTVTKGGYAPTTVEVKEIVKSEKETEIPLSRGAAIAGRVVRSSGEPVAGAPVRATRADKADAKNQNGRIENWEATTDDLGEFRIGGLAAGRYSVSPLRTATRAELSAELAKFARTLPDGRVVVEPPPFGTISLSAPLISDRSIDVRTGDDAGPVDFTADASQLQVVHMPLPIDEPVRMVPGVPLSREGADRARDRAAERVRTGGVISGAIVDQAGEPLEGIHVRALQMRQEGERAVARDIGLDRVTDDRGRYRLFGLPRGQYFVVASTNATTSGLDRAQGNAFTQVYYPGTPHFESAQSVQVDESREAAGIDLAFAPSRTVRVTGLALDAKGEPLVGQVRLVLAQNAGPVTPDPIVERVDWDGTFAIERVPSGNFVLQAVGTNPGHRDEFGAQYVTVEDRDPAPVVITTSVGAMLEGRFTVEGVRNPPLRSLSIHASPDDLDRAPAEGRGPDGLALFDEGRFLLSGLRGPMRLVPGELPSGWYLKSATIGGVDATDSPFDFGYSEHTFTDAEIILSPLGGTISGSATQSARTRARGFVAVAFSTTRDRWFTGSQYVKQRRGGPNGSFDVDGLPPGEYWVVALERFEASDRHIADVLGSLVQSATRVTVADGQVVSTDLRVVRQP
jgi:hypothetical protein